MINSSFISLKYFSFLISFTLITIASYPNKTDSLIALIDSTILSEEQVQLKLKVAEEISNADIKNSIVLAQQALAQAKLLDLDIYIAESNLAIGKYYDYLGVNAKALAHLNDALVLFNKLGDKKNKIQTIRLIGNIYFYIGEYDLAMNYYLDVDNLASENNDTSVLIRNMISRGAVYGNISKVDSAFKLFNQAHTESKIHDLTEYEMLSLYNIGDLYLYTEEPDKALKFFNLLFRDYDIEEVKSSLLSATYNSMTLAYIKTGNLAEAKKFSEKTRIALVKYDRLIEKITYYNHKYKLDSLEGRNLDALESFWHFKRLNDSLINSGFNERLANFKIVYDLEKIEDKIERLELDNQLKDLKIKQRKLVNYGAVAIILLLFIIVQQMIRSRKKTKEKNYILEKQKKELQLANEKISRQTIGLHQRNNELEELIEELKTTQQQLVQSEKMASLGTLIAGVAHEINNPLNYINGGVEIINELNSFDNEKTGDKYREQFQNARNIINEGVEKAAKIVSSLMTFSYPGRPKLKEYNITEILDSALIFLNAKIQPKIKIVKDYRFNDKALLYPDKLHQVFLNILDNSVYAVQNSTKSEKSIEIICKKTGDEIIITCSNNGPQIEEEEINKVFDPFYTTKDPGQGTGLGLSICYKLIAEHNGSIMVKNTLDGVSYIIKIPYLT